MQGARYLSSKMGYVKGLHSRICMAVVTTLRLQCILFLINLIALLGSTLALILNHFQKTLVVALFQDRWLKFLIMALTAELRMVCPTRRNISYAHLYYFTAHMQKRGIWVGFSCNFKIITAEGCKLTSLWKSKTLD